MAYTIQQYLKESKGNLDSELFREPSWMKDFLRQMISGYCNPNSQDETPLPNYILLESFTKDISISRLDYGNEHYINWDNAFWTLFIKWFFVLESLDELGETKFESLMLDCNERQDLVDIYASHLLLFLSCKFHKNESAALAFALSFSKPRDPDLVLLMRFASNAKEYDFLPPVSPLIQLLKRDYFIFASKCFLLYHEMAHILFEHDKSKLENYEKKIKALLQLSDNTSNDAKFVKNIKDNYSVLGENEGVLLKEDCCDLAAFEMCMIFVNTQFPDSDDQNIIRPIFYCAYRELSFFVPLLNQLTSAFEGWFKLTEEERFIPETYNKYVKLMAQQKHRRENINLIILSMLDKFHLGHQQGYKESKDEYYEERGKRIQFELHQCEQLHKNYVLRFIDKVNKSMLAPMNVERIMGFYNAIESDVHEGNLTKEMIVKWTNSIIGWEEI
ncbi:hypothetical protein FACS1894196_4480 [Clostridia bacterium]|nr:hypothetical protein FACS1894196_4480 [Clostridia bacterium]